MTIPLLTTPSGEKYGKSAGNAVWINEGHTSSVRRNGLRGRHVMHNVTHVVCACACMLRSTRCTSTSYTHRTSRWRRCCGCSQPSHAVTSTRLSPHTKLSPTAALHSDFWRGK